MSYTGCGIKIRLLCSDLALPRTARAKGFFHPSFHFSLVCLFAEADLAVEHGLASRLWQHSCLNPPWDYRPEPTSAPSLFCKVQIMTVSLSELPVS